MKTMKIFLAASALATVAGAANATTWALSMNATTPFPTAHGDLIMTGFTGSWDNVTNTGSWHGTTSIPGFATTMWYDQTFTMDETTGQGTLNTLFNCTANTSSACVGFSGALQGNIRNTQGVGNPENNSSYQQAHAFTPSIFGDTTYQWTLQIYKVTGQVDENGANIIDYIPMPMTVTLHGWSTCLDGEECPPPSTPPTVMPIPTTAWLFGSGLIGLASTARRRKSV